MLPLAPTKPFVTTTLATKMGPCPPKSNKFLWLTCKKLQLQSFTCNSCVFSHSREMQTVLQYVIDVGRKEN